MGCSDKESHVYPGGSGMDHGEGRGDGADEAGENETCWEGVG